MAYFATADEVYEHLGKVVQDIVDDPELGPELQKADTVVRYEYRDPEASITVRLRPTEAIVVELGETSLEPEVVMAMEADTAHEFFLGSVNVTIALARGQIKAKGPVAKILRLVPLVKPVFPRYRAQLEAAGREDLLGAQAAPA